MLRNKQAHSRWRLGLLCDKSMNVHNGFVYSFCFLYICIIKRYKQAVITHQIPFFLLFIEGITSRNIIAFFYSVC